MSNQLHIREWIIVALFLGLLLGISAFALAKNCWNCQPPKVPHEKISVKVTGAVAKPGTYTVSKQGGVSALLSLAEPLPNAILTEKIKIQKQGSDSILHIPCEEYTLVELVGAVCKEGEYKLPKKTRICDLPKFVEFSPDVDPSFLKRKRLLKEGELLNIPKRIGTKKKKKITG